jgi:hypothetical protein
MSMMPVVELTFKLSISEGSLDVMRREQEEGTFDVHAALALMENAMPVVDLIHVGDDN